MEDLALSCGSYGFPLYGAVREALVEGAGLYVSHRQAWHELTLPRTWATMIWIVVLLLVFVTMQEVSRCLEKAN